MWRGGLATTDETSEFYIDDNQRRDSGKAVPVPF